MPRITDKTPAALIRPGDSAWVTPGSKMNPGVSRGSEVAPSARGGRSILVKSVPPELKRPA